MTESVLAPAEPCAKLSKTAAGKWATAMRGRDEDDPAHLRHRFVEERLLAEAGSSSGGPMTWSIGRVQTVCHSRGPPLWTIIFARMPPKAVAHDDHSVEGRVRAVGIEDSTRPPQVTAAASGPSRGSSRRLHSETSRIETVFGVQGCASRPSIIRSQFRGLPQRPWIKTTGTLPRS